MLFSILASQPGKWNTSGCEVVQEESQTTCLCDHLTFFAVLMVSILQSRSGKKMGGGLPDVAEDLQQLTTPRNLATDRVVMGHSLVELGLEDFCGLFSPLVLPKPFPSFLLQVSSPDIDHIHYEYLTIVTYVGCVISALASFFTIFFFLCSK